MTQTTVETFNVQNLILKMSRRSQLNFFNPTQIVSVEYIILHVNLPTIYYPNIKHSLQLNRKHSTVKNCNNIPGNVHGEYSTLYNSFCEVLFRLVYSSLYKIRNTKLECTQMADFVLASTMIRK